MQHHGVLSFGFGPLRIGLDTEGIRHTFQNRVAHDRLWWYNYGEKNTIREQYGIPANKTVFIYGGGLGKPLRHQYRRRYRHPGRDPQRIRPDRYH